MKTPSEIYDEVYQRMYRQEFVTEKGIALQYMIECINYLAVNYSKIIQWHDGFFREFKVSDMLEFMKGAGYKCDSQPNPNI